MEKKVKVEIAEQSKVVTAKVYVEYSGETIDNNQVLEEVKQLFDKAHTYAQTKTLLKGAEVKNK